MKNCQDNAIEGMFKSLTLTEIFKGTFKCIEIDS